MLGIRAHESMKPVIFQTDIFDDTITDEGLTRARRASMISLRPRFAPLDTREAPIRLYTHFYTRFYDCETHDKNFYPVSIDAFRRGFLDDSAGDGRGIHCDFDR